MSVGFGVRFFKRRIKSVLFLFITDIIRIFVRKKAKSAILITKIDAIGDLFLWFSSGMSDMSEYAREFSGGSVIIVREELARFVSDLGLFGEVVPLNVKKFRSNLKYRFLLLCKLRRHGFSEVLQVRIARDFIVEDLIARTVGADIVRGPVGDRHNLTDWEARTGDAWYQPILSFDGSEAHELVRLRSLSSAAFGRAPRRFELPILSARPPKGLRPGYFIVAPGAGWAQRQWPLDSFIEVARRVVEATGLQCVVVGSGGDALDGARIWEAVGGGALSLCGTLSLTELAALIKGAEIVIGNESGPAHIAAYYEVPSLAILGGGHYGWFMPYPENLPGVRPPRIASFEMPCFGCNWMCQYPVQEGSPVPCIQRVSVEAAWSEISAALNDESHVERVDGH